MSFNKNNIREGIASAKGASGIMLETVHLSVYFNNQAERTSATEKVYYYASQNI